MIRKWWQHGPGPVVAWFAGFAVVLAIVVGLIWTGGPR
jgi:hypothetical protein